MFLKYLHPLRMGISSDEDLKHFSFIFSSSISASRNSYIMSHSLHKILQEKVVKQNFVN